MTKVYWKFNKKFFDVWRDEYNAQDSWSKVAKSVSPNDIFVGELDGRGDLSLPWDYFGTDKGFYKYNLSIGQQHYTLVSPLDIIKARLHENSTDR